MAALAGEFYKPAPALAAMLYGILAVLLSSAFLVGVYVYKRLSRYYASSLFTEFPYEPGTSLITGNYPDMKKYKHNPAALTLKYAEKYGDFFVMRTLHMYRLVSVNLDAIKYVLQTNPYNWVKSTLAVDILMELLGPGLLTYEGDEHAYHRKICQPAFSFSSVNSMVPIFDARSETLVQYWKSQLKSDGTLKIIALSEMTRLTFDVICESVFSVNLDMITVEDSRFGKIFSGLLSGMGLSIMNLVPFLRSLPTQSKKLRLASRKELTEEFLLPIVRKKRAALVASREAHLAAHPGTKAPITAKEEAAEEPDVSFYGDKLDLLDRLIVVILESAQLGVELTDEQLMGHVMTFAFAGHETTSTSLSWTLYALCKAPETEKKLREEVNRILGDKETITLADIELMTYLNNVLKESLRLYSPVSNTIRFSLEDDEICGKKVPAGTLLFVPIAAIHRLPQYWDRPDDFWPERWDSKTVNHNAWMPFISGPKSCIGNRMALMEMKVVLAKLVQRFNFVMDADYNPTKKIILTTRPDPIGPPLTLTIAASGWSPVATPATSAQ